ncbi:hypothetical protein MA16_Dca025226 [Dendrobium catenatum]|uniref:Retrotransposon gag domain-containing protein n=1 Tax=Dendrobium catenatum TaxID=906689 RepID=A0A2I0VEW8_9ASPA|nr:hypothetical protein MA16_Dca025226 [Dendrobium catenatum]
MDSIGFQKRLDDLVSLVGSLTKTTKESHVDSPHSRYVPHSLSQASRKVPHYAYQPRPETNPRQPHLESPYQLPTFDGSSDPYYFREWARQLDDYFESCHILESHQLSIAKYHLKGQALQFWVRLEDRRESSGEYLTWKDMRRELNLKYRPSTYGQPADSKFRSPPAHQTIGYYTLNTPTPSDRHLEHHPTPCRTNRGPYCGQDHPSFSSIRVTVPPCRSPLNIDDRPFGRPSVGSSPYDSTLGLTSSHPSQPLTSPVLDPASLILIKNCSKKKKSTEPETEVIHFVETIDNDDFFEDETEVIESDSQNDLNPELGKLEPVNVDTLTHPNPSFFKDESLDKVCLDDSRTSNTLILEDPDLVVTTTEMTLGNLDGNDFELEVNQLKLSPELNEPEPIDLKIMTLPHHIENISTNLKDSDLTLSGFGPNWGIGHPRILLESILGVAPLELHLKECDFLDWIYLTTPHTDFNVRENFSPYFHVTTLTVVPTSVPHFLSPIPAGDSFGYPILAVGQDPSPYFVPDSFVLPIMFLAFHVKDNLSPSWMNLLDDTVNPRRPPATLTQTSHRSTLVAKNVFIAPPTPVPLDRTL